MSEVATKTERASKEFWAITEQWTIERVTGYECPPNEKVWWVPSLGYSMTEGYHLFTEWSKARHKALTDLSGKIASLRSAYNELMEAKEPSAATTPAGKGD